MLLGARQGKSAGKFLLFILFSVTFSAFWDCFGVVQKPGESLQQQYGLQREGPSLSWRWKCDKKLFASPMSPLRSDIVTR